MPVKNLLKKPGPSSLTLLKEFRVSQLLLLKDDIA